MKISHHEAFVSWGGTGINNAEPRMQVTVPTLCQRLDHLHLLGANVIGLREINMGSGLLQLVALFGLKSMRSGLSKKCLQYMPEDRRRQDRQA